MKRQILMVSLKLAKTGEFSHYTQDFLILRFCARPQKHLLYAPEEGKYHNFEENLYQKHFYIAAAQFYKMLLKKPTWRRAETIKNQSEEIASVEYLVNESTLETFNSKKQFF